MPYYAPQTSTTLQWRLLVVELTQEISRCISIVTEDYRDNVPLLTSLHGYPQGQCSLIPSYHDHWITHHRSHAFSTTLAALCWLEKNNNNIDNDNRVHDRFQSILVRNINKTSWRSWLSGAWSRMKSHCIMYWWTDIYADVFTIGDGTLLQFDGR